MAWAEAIFGLAGVGLGGFISNRSAVRADERRASRDARASVGEFERSTLTELSSALVDLARQVTRHHLEDVRIAKATGDLYGSHRHATDEFGESWRLAGIRMNEANLLVLDDGLRIRVDDVNAACSRLSITPMSLTQAEAEHQAAMVELIAIQEEIGARVRKLWRQVSQDASDQSVITRKWWWSR